MTRFALAYKYSAVVIFNCLKILQQEGYLVFSKDVNNPSKVHFLIERNDLYKFQVANAAFDGFIKLLLRSYTGLFTDYVAIDEMTIARRAKVDLGTVYLFLKKLNSQKIISYIPRRNTPLILYCEERLDDKTLRIAPETYRNRKEVYAERVLNVIHYAFSGNLCRSRMLLEYFGEKDAPDCGTCDVCIKKNETGLTSFEFAEIKNNILQKLNEKPVSFNNLIEFLNFNSEKTIKVIRWLLDNNIVTYIDDQTIMLKK
jgi:ATP-dependent DNA helicase RecQ